MADDNQLAIRLEARIRDFERNMAKAARTADGQFGKIEKRAQQSASKVSSVFANFGTGLFAGIAAGGIAGIITKFGDVAKSVADIGREAKQAGLAAREFQEFRYVAEQARIPLDAMIDSFKELQLRSDQFVATGKGSAAEAFQRLGLSQSDVKERLQNPSDLLLEIIDRTKRLGDTAAGIRIFDEIFGGQGGEQLIQLTDRGREGIKKTIDEAHTLGAVMTDDVIKSAAELDQKFNQVSTTVGNALKGAIVSAAQALSNFIGLFQAFENRTSDTLQSQLTLLEKNIAATAKTKGKFGGVFDGPADKQIAENTAAADKIRAELKNRAMNKLKLDLTVQKTELENPIKPIVAPSKPGKKSDVDRERDKAAASAKREADQTRELIAELEHERSLIGKSAVEKAKMNELRNAGATATEAEKAKISELAGAIYEENKAFEETQDRLQQINDTARDVTGGIVSGLLDGASAADVFSDALKKIGDTLLNDVLDSIFQVNKAGGGSGILGSIFGAIGGGGFAGGGNLNYFPPIPGFASGTNYAPGGMALVGEKGPELVNLPRGSQVIPNHSLRAPSMPSLQRGGGGQSVVVHFSPVVDNRGASVEAVARTEEALAKMKRELPATILTTMTTARKTRAWK